MVARNVKRERFGNCRHEGSSRNLRLRLELRSAAVRIQPWSVLTAGQAAASGGLPAVGNLAGQNRPQPCRDDFGFPVLQGLRPYAYRIAGGTGQY